MVAAVFVVVAYSFAANYYYWLASDSDNTSSSSGKQQLQPQLQQPQQPRIQPSQTSPLEQRSKKTTQPAYPPCNTTLEVVAPCTAADDPASLGWKWVEYHDIDLNSTMIDDCKYYAVAVGFTHNPLDMVNLHAHAVVLTPDDTDPFREPEGYSLTADPFLVFYRGKWTMFVEVFAEASSMILYVEAPGATQQTLLQPWRRSANAKMGLLTSLKEQVVLKGGPELPHFSFPYVFVHDDQVFMLPQISEFPLTLFKATRFPTQWEWYATITNSPDAADAQIVQWNGVWYVFARSRYDNSCNVLLAPDLTGPWRPHPQSPWGYSQYYGCRGGGRILPYRGVLLMFAQHSLGKVYGALTRPIIISQLSPEVLVVQHNAHAYSAVANLLLESPIPGDMWAASAAHHVDMHQVSQDTWFFAFDGRESCNVTQTRPVWTKKFGNPDTHPATSAPSPSPAAAAAAAAKPISPSRHAAPHPAAQAAMMPPCGLGPADRVVPCTPQSDLALEFVEHNDIKPVTTVDDCGYYSIAIGFTSNVLDMANKQPHSVILSPEITRPLWDAAGSTVSSDPFLVFYMNTWTLFAQVQTKFGSSIMYVQADSISRNQLSQPWRSTTSGILQSLNEAIMLLGTKAPFSVSFPYTFMHGSDVFMLPQVTGLPLTLFKAASFPDKWQYFATILPIEAQNSQLVQWQGMWYLFTVGTRDQMCLLFMSYELTGPWESHPKSPYAHAAQEPCRGAGRVLQVGEHLVQFVQRPAALPVFVQPVVIQQLTPTSLVRVHSLRMPAALPNRLLADERPHDAWSDMGTPHVEVHQIRAREWMFVYSGREACAVTLARQQKGQFQVPLIAHGPGMQPIGWRDLPDEDASVEPGSSQNQGPCQSSGDTIVPCDDAILPAMLHWSEHKDVDIAIHTDDCKYFSVGLGFTDNPLDLLNKKPHALILTPEDTNAFRTTAGYSLVADPFLIHYQAKWTMFAEVFVEDGVAMIMWAQPQRATESELMQPWAGMPMGLVTSLADIVRNSTFATSKLHISFPYVFQHEDQVFMLPHIANYPLTIFVADVFPDQWRPYAVVIGTLHTADSQIVHWQGMWYVFTTLTKQQTCVLYVAAELSGPWKPHPKSPWAYTTGPGCRGAGRIMPFGNSLLMFVQGTAGTYGSYSLPLIIETLTALELQVSYHAGVYTSVANAFLAQPSPADRWMEMGSHHVDMHRVGPSQWMFVLDGREACAVTKERTVWAAGFPPAQPSSSTSQDASTQSTTIPDCLTAPSSGLAPCSPVVHSDHFVIPPLPALSIDPSDDECHFMSIGIGATDSPLALLSTKQTVPVLTPNTLGRFAAAAGNLSVAEPFFVYHDSTWGMFFAGVGLYSSQIMYSALRGSTLSDLQSSVSPASIMHVHSIADAVRAAGGPAIPRVSFPYTVSHERAVYMLPTIANFPLTLFRATKFPLEWEMFTTVLRTSSAVNSQIVHWDGRWYVFTWLAAEDMCVLMTASRLQGPWSQHRQSPWGTNSQHGCHGGGRIIPDGTGQLLMYIRHHGRAGLASYTQPNVIKLLSPLTVQIEPITGAYTTLPNRFLHQPLPDADWADASAPHVDVVQVSDSQWLFAMAGQEACARTMLRTNWAFAPMLVSSPSVDKPPLVDYSTSSGEPSVCAPTLTNSQAVTPCRPKSPPLTWEWITQSQISYTTTTDDCKYYSIGLGFTDNPFDMINLKPHTKILTPEATNAFRTRPGLALTADPFIIYHRGKWTLFAEVFAQGGAMIMFAEAPGTTKKELMQPWTPANSRMGLLTSLVDEIIRHGGPTTPHLSFPYVWTHEDRVYMIPQISNFPISIFVATQFPDKWELLTMVAGIYLAADCQVIRWNDVWYLFTAVLEEDQCMLFYATDLKGPWRRHPMSPWATALRGSCRGAGRIVPYGNVLLLLVQRSVHGVYGTYAQPLVITQLSTTTIVVERSADSITAMANAMLLPPAAEDTWAEMATHHVDMHQVGESEWMFVYDGREPCSITRCRSDYQQLFPNKDFSDCLASGSEKGKQ